jgi:hypothetical protein
VRSRTLAGGGLAAVFVVVAIVAAGCGGGGSPGGVAAGLQTSPPPWLPEYNNLPERLDALKLPPPSDDFFHIHAKLRVFADGKPVVIPANVGIDPATNTLASLHTHDTAGIVHMEATRRYPFKLGQLFDVLGVKFTASQLGSFNDKGTKRVQVYVNGKLVDDPVNYAMKAHDSIIVGYGEPGSFPKKLPADIPAGL